ncbi:hypothetical protein G6F37_009377 [Rhizopus arrhizus]|nr:hypothetical protein G6F38_007845 [Rhizopus arrhizus]KAG1154525.1 hypothetical protein G6F37_009377 [Rhizopus arrhizus]
MDFLLTLQSKQSNKVTNVAHTAETTFATRRFHSKVFEKKYHEYWESRKDSTLREDINNESRSAISCIQRLVHQNLIERANNVFSTSYSSSNCLTSNATFSDATISDATTSDTTTSCATTSNGLTKMLAQTIELASDYLAQLGVINLTPNSIRNILKMRTTEEEYENIILSVNVKKVGITESAKSLIQAIKDVKVYSCKNLRNALYTSGYKQNHDVISDYDIGLIENLVKHFLDLIESPKNPLNNTILERSAAVQTSIVITNQLFLAVNDIVELG